MLPLAGREFPTNRQELEAALRGGLAEVLLLPPDRPVIDAGGDYQVLDRLVIDVTDATPRADFRPAQLTKEKQPAPSVARFEVAGLPLRRDKAEVSVKGAVTDARFEFRRDQAGRKFFTLVDGREGKLSLRGRLADLNTLFLPVVQAMAAEYGVTIDDLQWTLAGHSDRQLAFTSRVKASKSVARFRMGTAMRSRGQVVIDDQLNVRFSGLACEGEGVLGNMLVGLVQSQLKRFEGTPVALSSFALGRLKLRSLQIRAEEILEVDATFGS